MAETEDDAGDLESSEETVYFLAIEKVFIDERGSPLYLSPKDWKVALRWYEMGVPLDWVERTLRELFEDRRARGTIDKVVSLGYCRRSVEAAWNRYQKMQVPAVEATEIDVEPRLEALAAALPESLADREAWAERLVKLEGTPEQVETRLQELDREVFAAAVAGLGAEAAREVEENLARALANLARRLGAQELEGATEQLRERLLRVQTGLPVLSLFAPEAAP